MSGIDLHCIERGTGKPLVLIPGWSQTARCYDRQIMGLSGRFHVIALDMRGHGESPKPPHGYRIARLAQDVHEFLVARDLQDVTLAGHSMGAAIVWSYCEQFERDRLGELVFIDEPPMVTNSRGLAGAALAAAGCAFTPQSLFEIVAAVTADQGAMLDGLRDFFFSAEIPAADVALNRQESMKIPAEYAARLMLDHASQDWRDVIAHVIPPLALRTLVVGGALETIFPVAAMRWIADQIPTAELSVFSAAERGSHFMFWENAAKFNAVLEAFIDGR